jgi:tetratricopeptide (TPR) repeat protein
MSRYEKLRNLVLKRLLGIFRSPSSALAPESGVASDYKENRAAATFPPGAMQRALDAGDHEAAEVQFSKLLVAGQETVPALMAAAAVAKARGDDAEAVNRLARAMELAAGDSELQLEAGLRLEELGAVDLALAAYACAARRKEPFPRALSRLGLLQAKHGFAEDALLNLAKVVQRLPFRAEAHNDLAVAYGVLGDFAEALNSFEQSLRLKPDSFEVLINAGRAAEALWENQRAVEYFRRALSLQPDSSKTKLLLGLSQLSGDDSDNLGKILQEVAAEDTYEAQFNVGIARMALDRFEEGWSALERARDLAPDRYETYCMLGYFSGLRGRTKEAAELYGKGIVLNPHDPRAVMSHGVILLTLGEFERGWDEYERRFELYGLKDLMDRFPRDALWDGSDLAGKTLLVWAEQGLGDQMQFIRYIPMLASDEAEVIVQCDKRLVRLFEQVPGASRIVSLGELWPAFDFHCPVVSLARVMRTRLDSIPARIPYLRAEPELAARWRDRLSHLSGVRVGLVWAGSRPGNMPVLESFDQRRSLALREFLPLWDVRNITFISLQTGTAAREVQELTPDYPLVDFADDLHDFADTAALVENLDLVISVDTSVAHLVGAMGKPVWILCRLGGDWRWLLDRTDSPWYPSARLFRQHRYMEWEPVVRDLRAALKDFVSGQGVQGGATRW